MSAFLNFDTASKEGIFDQHRASSNQYLSTTINEGIILVGLLTKGLLGKLRFESYQVEVYLVCAAASRAIDILDLSSVKSKDLIT